MIANKTINKWEQVEEINVSRQEIWFEFAANINDFDGKFFNYFNLIDLVMKFRIKWVCRNGKMSSIYRI